MSEVALDHIQFSVGDAANLAGYYHNKFGMQSLAELTTSSLEEYVLQSADVTFSITTAPGVPYLAESVKRHGDSVVDIALSVEDVDETLMRAEAAGAEILQQPEYVEDEGGVIRLGGFAVFGDMRHTIIDRRDYQGFLPGFTDTQSEQPNSSGALFYNVDHFTVCIPRGETAQWTEFYDKVLGFSVVAKFGDHIETDEPLGLATTIVGDKDQNIKLALTEPTPKQGGSQIDTFLATNQGSGIQHIALRTPNIVRCVQEMGANGVRFMGTPASYYNALAERVGNIGDSLEELEKLGILVDREGDGVLLQVFTKSDHEPPTSFFEIIERRGADGFGAGNVKALAAAVDSERAKA